VGWLQRQEISAYSTKQALSRANIISIFRPDHQLLEAVCSSHRVPSGRLMISFSGLTLIERRAPSSIFSQHPPPSCNVLTSVRSGAEPPCISRTFCIYPQPTNDVQCTCAAPSVLKPCYKPIRKKSMTACRLVADLKSFAGILDVLYGRRAEVASILRLKNNSRVSIFSRSPMFPAASRLQCCSNQANLPHLNGQAKDSQVTRDVPRKQA
jgi:hypothetical protein